MKTKIIPFDLEMAKKIQAEEIEGRIVTTVGGAARIVCFDKKTVTRHPLVVLIRDLRDPDMEYVGCYTTKGEVVGDEIYNLCIELPEESPKRKVKLADTINRIASTFSTEREGEAFKQGIIYAVSVDAEYKDQLGMYGKGGEETPNPLEKVLNKIKDSKWDGYFESKKEDCGQCFEDALVKETSKHEFKPFDKVLVRDHDDREWCADFYSHFSDGTYRCVSCDWNQCIPYEGNEHLVGTTDKPKEE